MNVRNHFKKAVKDESYRQQFLDVVADQIGIPCYVNKLIYYNDENSSEPSMYYCTSMETHPDPLSHKFIKGTKSEIIVLPYAFSPWGVHRNVDDFLSSLADHEYFHAQEYSENPKIIACLDRPEGTSLNRYIRRAEARAYKNQMEKFSCRNCSPKYKSEIIERHWDTLYGVIS